MTTAGKTVQDEKCQVWSIADSTVTKLLIVFLFLLSACALGDRIQDVSVVTNSEFWSTKNKQSRTVSSRSKAGLFHLCYTTLMQHNNQGDSWEFSLVFFFFFFLHCSRKLQLEPRDISKGYMHIYKYQGYRFQLIRLALSVSHSWCPEDEAMSSGVLIDNWWLPPHPPCGRLFVVCVLGMSHALTKVGLSVMQRL